MPLKTREKFGILPALELMPFFDQKFVEAVGVEFVSRASYGSIAREMLVGNLVGGILPWEIFASEVLALPGQRNQWKAAFFSTPSPTELVLQTAIHRSLCGEESGSSHRKIPPRLMIGIENHSSLTKKQFSEWLDSLRLSPRPELIFRVLPMDQRLEGLLADALDGFIARSPWGMIAEEEKHGVVVRGFDSWGIPQKLVTVCRTDAAACSRFCTEETFGLLTGARAKLSGIEHFKAAAKLMEASGKPYIPQEFLTKAAETYLLGGGSKDVRPDIATIIEELKALMAISMLPPQVAPNEQTARLLARE